MGADGLLTLGLVTLSGFAVCSSLLVVIAVVVRGDSCCQSRAERSVVPLRTSGHLAHSLTSARFGSMSQHKAIFA